MTYRVHAVGMRADKDYIADTLTAAERQAAAMSRDLCGRKVHILECDGPLCHVVASGRPPHLYPVYESWHAAAGIKEAA